MSLTVFLSERLIGLSIINKSFMMYRKWLTRLAVLVTCLAPLSTQAEVISQSFPDSFIYFPTGDESGVIYADSAFYEESNVAENQMWSDTGKRFDPLDLDEYSYFEFYGNQATYFEGYSYITATSDNPTETSFDGSTAMEQVWRLGHDSSGTITFDLVFEINTLELPAHFSDLMVIDGRLYALSIDGSGDDTVFWRTSNGTRWSAVTPSGLPEFDSYGAEYTVLGSGSTGYLGVYDTEDDITEFAIYKSTNGKQWSELTGDYNDGTLLTLDGPYGIASMDRIASQLYTVVSLGYTYKNGGEYSTSVWHKTGNKEWREDKVDIAGRIIQVQATKKNVYLATTQNNRLSLVKCNRKLTGCTTGEPEADMTVVGSFRLGKRAIFIVSSDEGIALFRF